MDEKNDAPQKSSGKVSGSLVSAGFAAVFAVYMGGYIRTESAAQRFASQVAERRPQYHPAAMAVASAPPPATAETSAPPEPSRNPAPEPKAPIKAAPAVAVKHVDASAEPQPAEEAAPAQPVAPAVAPAPAAAEVTAPAPVQALPPAPAPAPAPPPAPPAASVWKDGTYTGWGYSRHGNIEAQVVIENGRITSAGISQCRTRYSCNVIDRLPPQVIERQSPDVDYVSGATQSADAFYGAVSSALNTAK